MVGLLRQSAHARPCPGDRDNAHSHIHITVYVVRKHGCSGTQLRTADARPHAKFRLGHSSVPPLPCRSHPPTHAQCRFSAHRCPSGRPGGRAWYVPAPAVCSPTFWKILYDPRPTPLLRAGGGLARSLSSQIVLNTIIRQCCRWFARMRRTSCSTTILEGRCRRASTRLPTLWG